MTRLFCFLGIILISLGTFGQTNEFDKDIEKLLAINGSSAAYDMAFDQMTAQLKMMKVDAPEEVWKQVRTEVFDMEIVVLIKQMVPIYKKHLSHADVKGLIKFYESPLGKKLTNSTGKMTGETMQMAQAWGMGLGQKITSFLTEKGY